MLYRLNTALRKLWKNVEIMCAEPNKRENVKLDVYLSLSFPVSNIVSGKTG